MYVKKVDPDNTQSVYNLTGVSADQLIALVELMTERKKKLRAELANEKFAGDEDQMFLTGQLAETYNFLRAAQPFFELTDDGNFYFK